LQKRAEAPPDVHPGSKLKMPDTAKVTSIRAAKPAKEPKPKSDVIPQGLLRARLLVKGIRPIINKDRARVAELIVGSEGISAADLSVQTERSPHEIGNNIYSPIQRHLLPYSGARGSDRPVTELQ